MEQKRENNEDKTKSSTTKGNQHKITKIGSNKKIKYGIKQNPSREKRVNANELWYDHGLWNSYGKLRNLAIKTSRVVMMNIWYNKLIITTACRMDFRDIV